MKNVPWLCLLMTFILSGCEDISAPLAIEPGQPLVAKAEVQSSGVALWEHQAAAYVDCVSEEVAFAVSIPYKWHLTVTPSGNVIFTDQFLRGGRGSAVGKDSGTLWTLDRVSLPEVIRVTKGELYHAAASEWWVSETGPTMHIRHLVHILQDAQGQIRSEKVDVLNCKLL
ncbi:MAG: hypothetical protein KY466_09405 [Gemmatimonadetes bacterium]|nr:hypothetical protein [Gemmatimonadota bacterium]